MKILLEEVTTKNKDAFLSVVRTVYEGNKQSDLTTELPDCDHYLALVDDNVKTTPVGIYRRIKFDTIINSAEHPTSGIALVGVLPQFRSDGVGKALLNHAVNIASQEKMSFAALYPFSEKYYRQFDFASARPMMLIQCPLELMPNPKMQLSARVVDHNEVEVLANCYRKFIERRAGYCSRTPFLWTRKIFSNPQLLVYGFGDPLEAYVVVNLHSRFHEPLEIHEFVWLTIRGYESGLSFFKQLAINKSDVKWLEPEESPFLRSYVETSPRINVHARSAVQKQNQTDGNIFR